MSEDSIRPGDLAGQSDRFILLSGCSGGGKSTLLAALQQRGFRTFEEPGRQIVKEQQAIGGPGLPWRDAGLFCELCVSRAMNQMAQAAAADDLAFFDRGIVDAVAFLDYLGRPVPAHLETAARRMRYNTQVFMTPPWPEIFSGDSERRHGLDEAIAQYQPGLATFRRLGYRPLELPRTGVEERVQFLLDGLAREGMI
ncbi:MAG: AAA family ATPase [Shinella sp.]|nr:AAA family ATPase [Shinella sp.]